jgi:hypothetical protein
MGEHGEALMAGRVDIGRGEMDESPPEARLRPQLARQTGRLDTYFRCPVCTIGLGGDAVLVM